MSLRRRSLGLLGALAIGVAACGGAASPTPVPATPAPGETPAPATEAPPAGSADFAFAVDGEPTYFSYAYTDLPTSWIVSLLYTGLYTVNNKLDVVPDLAGGLRRDERGRPDLDRQAEARRQVPGRDRGQGLRRRLHLPARPVHELHVHPGRLLEHPGQHRLGRGDRRLHRQVRPEADLRPVRGHRPLRGRRARGGGPRQLRPPPGLHRRGRPGRGHGPRREDHRRHDGRGVQRRDPPAGVRLRHLHRRDGADPDVGRHHSSPTRRSTSTRTARPNQSAYGSALFDQLRDLNTTLTATDIDQIAASFRILDFQRAPIGTGPYKFVKYTTGQSVELGRHEDYFGGPEGAKVGPAKVFIPIIKDAAAASAALQKGDINWQTEITSDALATLKADPNLQIAEYPTSATTSSPSTSARGASTATSTSGRRSRCASTTRRPSQAATEGNGVAGQGQHPAGLVGLQP